MHPSGSGDEVGVIDHGGNHEEVNSASHVLATSRLHLPVNVCQEGKKMHHPESMEPSTDIEPRYFRSHSMRKGQDQAKERKRKKKEKQTKQQGEYQVPKMIVQKFSLKINHSFSLRFKKIIIVQPDK